MTTPAAGSGRCRLRIGTGRTRPGAAGPRPRPARRCQGIRRRPATAPDTAAMPPSVSTSRTARPGPSSAAAGTAARDPATRSLAPVNQDESVHPRRPAARLPGREGCGPGARAAPRQERHRGTAQVICQQKDACHGCPSSRLRIRNRAHLRDRVHKSSIDCRVIRIGACDEGMLPGSERAGGTHVPGPRRFRFPVRAGTRPGTCRVARVGAVRMGAPGVT